MTRWLPVLWIGSTGCPYVFAPDFSHVGGDGPGGTGGTGHGTTPAPTGETGGATFPGPAVLTLSAVPNVLGLKLVATVDGDDDLDGGALLLDVSGRRSELAIPSEAALPGGDRVLATIALALPCAGIDEVVTASVRDVNGLEGAPATVTVTVPGLGDLGDQVAVHDLGTLAVPVLWCGGTEEPQDRDKFSFLLPADDRYVFTTSWDSGGIFDLQLRDADGVIGSSVGTTQPEVLKKDLLAATSYELHVYDCCGMDLPDTWLLWLAADAGTTAGTTGDTGP